MRILGSSYYSKDYASVIGAGLLSSCTRTYVRTYVGVGCLTITALLHWVTKLVVVEMVQLSHVDHKSDMLVSLITYLSPTLYNNVKLKLPPSFKTIQMVSRRCSATRYTRILGSLCALSPSPSITIWLGSHGAHVSYAIVQVSGIWMI
jgi:hypothetical protein